MKGLSTALVLLTLIAMGNVVAVGVFLVLADIVLAVALLRDNYLVWLAAGLVACASALAFLAGAIPACFKALQRL